jgi:hypothetical protein
MALGKRLEGWPAALFLAALSIRNGTPPETLDGSDGFLADYLETEHLSVLTGAQRRFARSAAVLDELTPGACDALLGRRDSKGLLEALESAGVVAAIDHHHRRFRYPRIVRDVLLGELEQAEPEQARELHRAAAVRAAELGSLGALTSVTAADAEVAEQPAALAVSSCGRGGRRARAAALVASRARRSRTPISVSPPRGCTPCGAGRPTPSTGATRRCAASPAPTRASTFSRRCAAATGPTRCSTTRPLPAGPCLRAPRGGRPPCSPTESRSCWRGMPPGRAAQLGQTAETAAAELRTVGLCCLALLVIAGDAHLDADAFAAEAAAAAAANPPARSVVALLVEAVAARNAARRDETAEATAALERAEQLLD